MADDKREGKVSQLCIDGFAATETSGSISVTFSPLAMILSAAAADRAQSRKRRRCRGLAEEGVTSIPPEAKVTASTADSDVDHWDAILRPTTAPVVAAVAAPEIAPCSLFEASVDAPRGAPPRDISLTWLFGRSGRVMPQVVHPLRSPPNTTLDASWPTAADFWFFQIDAFDTASLSLFTDAAIQQPNQMIDASIACWRRVTQQTLSTELGSVDTIPIGSQLVVVTSTAAPSTVVGAAKERGARRRPHALAGLCVTRELSRAARIVTACIPRADVASNYLRPTTSAALAPVPPASTALAGSSVHTAGPEGSESSSCASSDPPLLRPSGRDVPQRLPLCDVENDDFEAKKYLSRSLSDTGCQGCLLGVQFVWIHPSFRGCRLASRVVDAARRCLHYGYEVPIEHVAFAAPTTDGAAFAAAYTGRKDFLTFA